MFAQIGEIAPKALIVGSLCWAGVNWAYLGPELGLRTMRANGHLETCKRGFNQSIHSQVQIEINKIPLPIPDPEKEMAVQSLRQMMRSPLGDLLKMTGQHTGIDLNAPLQMYEEQKRLAAKAYARAVRIAKEKTTTRLAKASDYCGCLAGEAVGLAQNEFALYSGTLTIFRPGKIKNLDHLMARTQSSGVCKTFKGDRS